ncbi:MAG: co-chaperone GroES [Planctomycetota bacterium]
MAKKVGIKPLGDRVVVKRLEAEQTTKGGIVLPDTAKEKPKQGEVVAVGQGKVLDSGETQEMQLQVGDRVIFGSYAGTEVTVGDEDYLILSESDVLAVVE